VISSSCHLTYHELSQGSNDANFEQKMPGKDMVDDLFLFEGASKPLQALL
jgi:hypothetical protein